MAVHGLHAVDCCTLALALWLSAVLGVADAALTRFNRTGGRYEICISAWAPMISCEEGEVIQASGYMAEVFKRVAHARRWALGEDYFFRCTDWTPMIDDLLSPNGTCYASAAGMDVLPDLIAQGVQFSWPTYKQGLRILVAAKVDKPNSWKVFNVFDWHLWLAIGGAGLAVAVFLWITESYGAALAGYKMLSPEEAVVETALKRPSRLDQSKPKGGARGRVKRMLQGQAQRMHYDDVEENFFRSFATLVGFAQPEPITLSGRMVALAYGLMILLLVSLFTANTAAIVTTTELKSKINSVSDLPGKRIGTWQGHLSALQKYGVLATGMSWENSVDEAAMLARLRKGEFDALVLDASFVQYQGSLSCDLHAVGEVFNTWDLSLAFPPEVSAIEVEAFTSTIIDEQRSYSLLDDLATQFLSFTGACSEVPEEQLQMKFLHVAGLWIILAGAMALGFLVLLAQCYLHGRHKRKLLKSLDPGDKERLAADLAAATAGGVNGGLNASCMSLDGLGGSVAAAILHAHNPMAVRTSVSSLLGGLGGLRPGSAAGAQLMQVQEASGGGAAGGGGGAGAVTPRGGPGSVAAPSQGPSLAWRQALLSHAARSSFRTGQMSNNGAASPRRMSLSGALGASFPSGYPSAGLATNNPDALVSLLASMQQTLESIQQQQHLQSQLQNGHRTSGISPTHMGAALKGGHPALVSAGSAPASELLAAAEAAASGQGSEGEDSFESSSAAGAMAQWPPAPSAAASARSETKMQQLQQQQRQQRQRAASSPQVWLQAPAGGTGHAPRYGTLPAPPPLKLPGGSMTMTQGQGAAGHASSPQGEGGLSRFGKEGAMSPGGAGAVAAAGAGGAGSAGPSASTSGAGGFGRVSVPSGVGSWRGSSPAQPSPLAGGSMSRLAKTVPQSSSSATALGPALTAARPQNGPPARVGLDPDPSIAAVGLSSSIHTGSSTPHPATETAAAAAAAAAAGAALPGGHASSGGIVAKREQQQSQQQANLSSSPGGARGEMGGHAPGMDEGVAAQRGPQGGGAAATTADMGGDMPPDIDFRSFINPMFARQ